MNEVIRQMMERKSVRAYEDRPIEPEKKELILQAAIEAPTAGNLSLYTILDITDPEKRRILSETCDHQPFIAQAPLFLIFAADYQRWFDAFRLVSRKAHVPGQGDLMIACSDALIAAQNAVSAAWSLGIGSCYIGDILEHYEEHRELLSLPPYVFPVTAVCFGYPTRQQKERRKPARFDRRFLVRENAYHRMSEGELEEMLGARRKQEGKEVEGTQREVEALLKRKWEAAFSREMNRSAAEMIALWGREDV